MKILVTGGCGFIGTNFVLAALKRGYEVINLDLLTYASVGKKVLQVGSSPNYRFELADICDLRLVQQIIYSAEPDYLVHFAAESHVDRSIAEPVDFISTNIFGTYSILEVCRNALAKNILPQNFKLIHVSTDEVFGSLPVDGYFDETSSFDPRSPYAASKASSDHLVSAWFNTYGLPSIICNCTNNYGKYQHPEKLIPKTIISSILGDQIPVYGRGQQVRDWIHVHDHISALFLVLEFGMVGERYTIGSDSQLKNIDLVRMICTILDGEYPKRFGSYKDQINFVDDRPGHDFRYAIDATKINTTLGWHPKIELEVGIQETV